MIYSYTTTKDQDATISAQLARVNPDRAAQGLPDYTPEAMIQDLVNGIVEGFGYALTSATASAVSDAYTKATPTDQAAVIAALKIVPPLPVEPAQVKGG